MSWWKSHSQPPTVDANAASTEDTAVETAHQVTVQTVDEPILVEAAVQTVSTTKKVAVQAVLPQKPVQPPRHVPAVSAGWRPHLPHVQAVSVGHPQLHQGLAARAACPHLHHHVPAVNVAHLAQARHLPQP